MNKIRPDTSAAIIEAAFEVFSANPSASLSVVADRAGVGRATLHRYFPGRRELMRALAKLAIEELDMAVEKAIGMQHFRQQYGINDTVEQGVSYINALMRQQPGILLHVDVSEGSCEGIHVLDTKKRPIIIGP